MTALILNQEFDLMRLRFQRTLAISIGLHVLLFGWLMINHNGAPLDLPAIEITWLEQEPLPVPVSQEIKTAPIPAVPQSVEPQLSVREKLARDTSHATDVRQKLDHLQPALAVNRALSSLPRTADLLNTAQATMAPLPSAAPAHLNRGQSEHQPAVALTRGATSSHHAAAAVVDLSIGNITGSGAAAAEPAAASEAVRNLGGTTIKGMVADRRVLSHPMPIYPAWATAEAVEATVTLYFLVMPDGHVKENVQVQKMASASDFDDNAAVALRQWRFEALAGHDAHEQWGTITFRYRLND